MDPSRHLARLSLALWLLGGAGSCAKSRADLPADWQGRCRVARTENETARETESDETCTLGVAPRAGAEGVTLTLTFTDVETNRWTCEGDAERGPADRLLLPKPKCAKAGVGAPCAFAASPLALERSGTRYEIRGLTLRRSAGAASGCLGGEYSRLRVASGSLTAK